MQLACSNPSAMPGTAVRGTWVIQAHPGWGLAGADPVEVKLGRGVWEAGEAPEEAATRRWCFGEANDLEVLEAAGG